MLVSAPRLLLFATLSLVPVRAFAADGAAPASVAPPTARPAATPLTAKAAPAATKAPGKSAKAGKSKGPKNPPVTLFSVNHKETLSLRLRDAQGKPIKGNQKRFDRFLRCHHTE